MQHVVGSSISSDWFVNSVIMVFYEIFYALFYVCRSVLLYLWDPRLDLTSVRCMTKTVGFRSPVYYLSIQVVSKY